MSENLAQVNQNPVFAAVCVTACAAVGLSFAAECKHPEKSGLSKSLGMGRPGRGDFTILSFAGAIAERQLHRSSA